jgi:hypothetical protein
MIKEISICTIILIWSNNILVITVHSTPCSPAILLHCTTLNDTSFPINFTLFHFTSHLVCIPFKFSTTSLHFASPHFTSLYFTTLQYTSLLPDFRHTSITFTSPRLYVIAFLTLFLKVLDLHGKVPNTSAASWFQIFMVLFTKKYFPISVLCFLCLIFRTRSTLLR